MIKYLFSGFKNAQFTKKNLKIMDFPTKSGSIRQSGRFLSPTERSRFIFAIRELEPDRLEALRQ